MSQQRTETEGDRGDSARDQVLALSRAYILSRAIHEAAELRVANHVGATPVSADGGARETHSQAPFLKRLLCFLAGHGIFREVSPGLFVATPLSDTFRDDAPGSLGPALRMVNAAWWSAVGDVGHAVTTGETAFSHLHGQGFFAYLKDHEADQARFDAGMACNSRGSDQAIARAYDFSQHRAVLDIGGGRGGLIRAIVENLAGVEGILFDQPQVVERSLLPSDGDLAKRCRRVAGDFFKEVPTGADVYCIKGVLHDFDDAQCGAILESCRRAMTAESKLFIVERLIRHDNQPHQAKTIDLMMMALLGGEEAAPSPTGRACSTGPTSKLLRQIPTQSEFAISVAALV